MGTEVRSKLIFPPIPAKAESSSLRLSQIVCTPFKLTM